MSETISPTIDQSSKTEKPVNNFDTQKPHNPFETRKFDVSKETQILKDPFEGKKPEEAVSAAQHIIAENEHQKPQIPHIINEKYKDEVKDTLNGKQEQIKTEFNYEKHNKLLEEKNKLLQIKENLKKTYEIDPDPSFKDSIDRVDDKILELNSQIAQSELQKNKSEFRSIDEQMDDYAITEKFIKSSPNKEINDKITQNLNKEVQEKRSEIIKNIGNIEKTNSELEDRLKKIDNKYIENFLDKAKSEIDSILNRFYELRNELDKFKNIEERVNKNVNMLIHKKDQIREMKSLLSRGQDIDIDSENLANNKESKEILGKFPSSSDDKGKVEEIKPELSPARRDKLTLIENIKLKSVSEIQKFLSDSKDQKLRGLAYLALMNKPEITIDKLDFNGREPKKAIEEIIKKIGTDNQEDIAKNDQLSDTITSLMKATSVKYLQGK